MVTRLHVKVSAGNEVGLFSGGGNAIETMYKYSTNNNLNTVYKLASFIHFLLRYHFIFT